MVAPPCAVVSIYIPGKLDSVSVVTVKSYDVCKYSSILWPDGRVRLFAHHIASLPPLCRPIWKHWTSEMLDSYSVSGVSKIKSVLPISLYAMHGVVRIQLTHFSYRDFENTYTLSWYQYQIGNMSHLPLFSVRSWNNGIRCMSFYSLMVRLKR